MGTGLIYTNARNNVIKHGYEDVYGRNVSLWEYKLTHESGNTLLKVTPPGRRLSVMDSRLQWTQISRKIQFSDQIYRPKHICMGIKRIILKFSQLGLYKTFQLVRRISILTPRFKKFSILIKLFHGHAVQALQVHV